MVPTPLSTDVDSVFLVGGSRDREIPFFRAEPNPHGGFTLLEVVVVLVLLSLAVALVAPSFRRLPHAEGSGVVALIHHAREAAVRRGEAVRLRINRAGRWRLTGEAGRGTEILMAGDSGPIGSYDLALVFSPLGTCGPDPDVSGPTAVLALDPLTCEVDSS